jgi:hypothetical protein
MQQKKEGEGGRIQSQKLFGAMGNGKAIHRHNDNVSPLTAGDLARKFALPRVGVDVVDHGAFGRDGQIAHVGLEVKQNKWGAFFEISGETP